MNFLNIIEENLPFLVIGLMIIVIVVLAYYTFIKPKPNKIGKENKKTEEDQSIIKQDSEILKQTSKASSVEKSSEDDQNQDDSSHMDASKPVIIETGEDDENTSEEDPDSNLQTSEDKDESKEQDKDDSSEEEEEKTELGKYHITYRQKDNKWIVVREGSDKTIRVLHTKKEAIAYATIKAINQDTNIVIHGEDGKIEKHGY